MQHNSLTNTTLPTGGGNNSLEIPANVRIDYIDLFKGFAILCVIWFHSDNFGAWHGIDLGMFANTAFFFTSGIFFKLTNSKSFFSKRISLIIIPFLFFYVASVPFRIVLDLWDYRTLTNFDWTRIFDVFQTAARNDYLSINVPLWFLLTLFWIQVFSFMVFRLKKWIIALLAITSLCLYELLYSIPTPFMLNKALAWFGYFAVGYLAGKPLIRYLNSVSRKLLVIILSVTILAVCIAFEQLEINDWDNLLGKTKLIVIVIAAFTFFSFCNNLESLDFLRFFGKNSLIVLGAHVWILIPIERLMFKLTGIHSPYLGLLMTIMTAAILVPVILWMNKRIPSLVGIYTKPSKATS